MDCDEHIILKKLRDGDSEALDILYLRYASKVRDFAFRLLKDRTDAEDVTHDIFLKIWEQRRGLGAVLSFRRYLFRMTRNAIFNAYKHRQVESKYQAETGAAGYFDGYGKIGVLKAHEFHYYDTTANGTAFHAQKPAGKRNWDCIISRANLLAGFPHIYYYANPKFDRL